MDVNSVGRTIRWARKRAGMTQHGLATAADMPQPSIARIERGTVIPRTATLIRLLGATGHQLVVEPSDAADGDHPMRTTLDDAFAHNAWATLRVLDACMGLSPEQLETSVPGTYGSILETLRHLVGADASYLWVVTAGQHAEIDEERMDLAGLRAEAETHAGAWSELLASDSDPEADVVRHRDDGTQSHASMGLRLAQVIHHGTDHRSQVATALTGLGIEPPEIDMWAYADEQGRISVTEPT